MAGMTDPRRVTAKQGKHLLIGGIVLLAMGALAMFLAHRESVLDPERLPEYLRAARRDPVPFLVGAALLLLYAGIAIKWMTDVVSVMRFGLGSLQLDPAPGSIGGHVGGRVRMRYALREGDVATMTLTCYRRYTRKSGGKRETTTERYWSDEVRPEIAGEFGAVVMYFTMDVPANLPPTGKKEDDHFSWDLTLRIDRPGRDVVRSFDVPVVADEVPRHAARPMGEPTRTSGAADFPGLAINDTGNELVVKCLPGRASGMNIAVLLFGSVFAAVGMGIGYGVAAEMWSDLIDKGNGLASTVFSGLFAVMTSFMSLVFSTVGLLLVFVAVSGMRNQRETRIATGSIQTRNHGTARVIPVNEIASFEMTETSSSGASAWFDINAITRSGESVALAETIPGKAAARHVVDLLKKHVDVPVEELDRTERRARRRALRRQRRMSS